MASRRKYRERWMRWHGAYERRAYRLIKPVFNAWGKSIPFDELRLATYKAQILFAIDPTLMNEPYLEIYRQVGAVHGRRVGASINLQLKRFQFDVFISEWQLEIQQFFNTFGVNRITSINQTYFNDIIALIESRLERGLTIQEAAKEIEKLVNNNRFYRWQALRIARTESTAAANYAAKTSGRISGFQMESEWISALDERTRHTHRANNGKRVDEGEKFQVGRDEMLFPGDPTASVGEVANCRCTIAVIAKRDSDGALIPTS